MNHSPHKIVSTLEALTSSIDHDGQVYRWFTFLVSQPEVKSKFTEKENGKGLYQKLDVVRATQIAIGILSLVFLIGVLYLQKYKYLMLGLVLIYALIKLNLSKRRYVKDISRQLLEQDFEPSGLGQKTLYQISELYSRKYNIPSFVDAVYFADAITRKSMLVTVFCIPFIVQLNLWQAVLTLMGAYYFPYFIANHPAVYRRLK